MPENIQVMTEVDNSIEIGKLLANPPAGEEVVISGLSGSYPESNNVYEFRDNLFNKVDMVTGDQRRWKEGHPEIPQRTGKIPDIDQFDAGFFGINHLQANQMDPMSRIFLEKAVEAIFDAGVHPSELEGTNTGVFVGSCFSETEKTWFTDKLVPHGFAVTGCTRSMLAHRISQHLKLKGPSFNCDTACSSSLYALENAYKALRMGQCDRAIVGGSNLCLHPYVSLQFARLGVLSLDGKCKSFDQSGNGYTRSEAISAVILQKAKDAKRVYVTILHAKTNCDGYKNSGITYPSGEMQIRLLKEFYRECDYINPSELSFVEAHGTGTKVGDPEETGAIDEVFTKNRSLPLLIGSVKSNIGHSEPTSGLCSITKAIIAAETGYIPPNLHYKTARPGIKGLEEGRLKVVTEKTRFNNNKGLIGVNSFGFGGGNCHVLLKHNTKEKTTHKDNIPRLVCVSGRNPDAINSLLDDTCANNTIDVEHIRLLQEIFRKNIKGHVYRGYTIVSKAGEITRSLATYKYSTANLIICFGIIDEQTRQKFKEFLGLPIAATALQKIQDALNPKKINIHNSLSSNSILDKILGNFVIQIIFADLLKACHIKPNKTFGVSKGLSLGALVCAYFDGALTLQEATECAFIVADIAQSLGFKGQSDTIDLSEVLKSNEKAANDLQQKITKVLKTTVRNNGLVDVSAANLINGLNVNLLKNVKNMLENKAALLEIGNGTITEVLKGNNETKSFIKCNGGISDVLAAIGSLYELGLNPQIQNIFPRIEFPVSRGTPMISPKIKWNHTRNWWVTSYDKELIGLEEQATTISSANPAYLFMKGHVIDGRNLIPATGYLLMAWNTLAQVHGLMFADMKVVFENCKFKRATPLPKKDSRMELIVMIQRGSGNFEVIEGDEPVVTGRIYHVSTDEPILDDLPMPCGVNPEIAPYMNKKDVYKELRLRGYNYSGQFKQIVSCDSSAQVGSIAWDGNWTTFIDNMLQLNILQEDSRLLYVPTHINKLIIDANKHVNYASSLGEEPIPVHSCKVTGITRSGGIELRGQSASSIARRKYQGIPVLEKYVFVPNIAPLPVKEALRVNMQILLENLPSLNIKVVELIDEATNEQLEPLVSIIDDVLGDIPLIQPNLTILSKKEYDIKKVKIENKQLVTETDCSLVIGSKLLERNTVLKSAFGSIKENGFILSREPLNVEINPNNNKEISIVTIYSNDKEKLVLLRNISKFSISSMIQVSQQDTEFSWIQKLQNAMTKNGNILVLSQGEPLNGVLGLVSCLRREPGGGIVKLLFTQSSAPDFDLNSPFYKNQLDKNLAFNVYKDGQWGTYRHLLLNKINQINAEQCYLNSLRRGDLSSLTWIEGPLKINSKLDPEQKLVYVHYGAINFRDIMLASGKLNADAVTRNRLDQECVLGFEIAGVLESGERVIGMGSLLGSIVSADEVLLWKVPDNWSLEEAITVPVVYCTSIVGLITKAKIKKGESVLIHSGTGGVGLSAIQIALYLGCVVYTTVGTLEKREFLKRRFPQLKDCHISNSRTTEFEQHIMKETGGKGVDVVLNSLADDKLQASVRCLAHGGRFIEIGKFDLANNNSLSMLFLEKEASFHGVMVDGMMKESCESRMQLYKSFQKLLNAGAIRPLPRTVFKMNEAEAAFRYMTTGKHIGKVVLQLREENKGGALQKEFLCQPRYYCDPEKSYIICGGLGGFGLELADWLVLRGCRNLVLTSRSGVKTGYQAYRISIWKSYGCTITISTEDITTYEGCVSLIKKSNELGPVHGIFNLAVVLRDGIFDNQTQESFETSFGPKAHATAHLDAITRELCPELKDFVIFSSVSCGRGNAGQSNYGMSNSVMERICEKRKIDGLPALAIEWGAIGDVGLVADMQEEAIDMEIGGTLQQRISNCLEVMDQLLKQTESAIVSSIVVAEKKSKIGNVDTVVEAVASILGVDNLKDISLQATLAEVGMDSMTAVEIKQTLERDHEVYLTAQDIKTMTFGKLIDIQAEMEAEKLNGEKKERALTGMDMIMRYIPDEATANTISVEISVDKTTKDKPTVFLFPGIEGQIKTLEPLFKQLTAKNLIGLQYPVDKQHDTIEDIAKMYLGIIEATITKKYPFKIVCYSYGGSVALETVNLLEQKGYSGTLICIDGAPNYLKALASILEADVDEKLQISLIVHMVTLQHPYEVISKQIDSLLKRDTFEDKIEFVQTVVPPSTTFSPKYERDLAVNVYKRLKALVKWTPDFKLKSQVYLFKPTLVSINTPDEVSGLTSLCALPIIVKQFDGNHLSVLENPELAQAVNEVFGLVTGQAS
ncbi:unnamed protein product [Ceutorhynchus assimilis]|uniref:Uncharacterized protein n=1 Tax=Ceutorhynchus assimilis TaxID=467358 RepID=A0A9N9MSQ7_9CUCU|nr:unnamed protein product [Ceutorhynchus assimilis]